MAMRNNHLSNVLEAVSQSTMERAKNEERRKSLARNEKKSNSLSRKESLRSQAGSVGYINLDILL